MKFKLYLALALWFFNTGCFSLVIRKGESEADSYWTQVKKQNEEAVKIDAQLSFEKSLEQCRSKPTKYVQRVCYSHLFKNNEDKTVCKKLNSNSIAQYVCYFQIIKDKRLNRSDLKTFCSDDLCIAVYAYRHYGTDGAQPDLLRYREQARQIESETSYQLMMPMIMPENKSPSRGLEFYEVVYAGLRTNRAFGLGYDLNFKHDNNELPSIGFGYYNLAEKVFSVDVVISGVQKPAAARLALGADFKDNYDTHYHLLYAFGVGAKSLGVAPLIEISSDFNKDHQLVIGIMMLFQVPRRNE